MSLLQRPLNVFLLPPDLLDSLTVRSIQATGTINDTSLLPSNEIDPLSQPSSQPSSLSQTQTQTLNGNTTSSFRPTPGSSTALASFSGLGCQNCPGAVFDTIEDQRGHFKSDWHRYNAKARLGNRKTVTVEEWESMVEGVSSISGSESSSSGGSASYSRVTRLLNKAHLGTSKADDVESTSSAEAELIDARRRAQLRTATIWFAPSTSLDSLGIPKDTQFGVHRALFPAFEHAAQYLEELKRMQLSVNPYEQGLGGGVGEEEEAVERRMTLLMVAGGHFAGMVVGLRPRGKNERQDVKGAGDVRVIHHKTFHRYTTRKKQGGSQGLNDNAKSKAISAGAMLRRYGEQALRDEIRALLADWAEDIASSERIFLRASTHGKKSFWGYEGAVLDKSDERIRTFPFPTRRPTQQELLRCWHELTRVKVSHLSEDALRAQDEAYIASIQPKKSTVPKSTPTPSVPSSAPTPKLSPEEEARVDRLRRLTEMIKKGRLEALQPFWTKYQTQLIADGHDIDALCTASVASQESIVKYLLEDCRVDPTKISSNPSYSGKRAYDLAGSKSVRNVFRRCAYEHPDWYDWVKDARVPSGLSEEAEAEQAGKKAERRKGLREKMKERERERVAKIEAEAEEEKRLKDEQAASGKFGGGPIGNGQGQGKDGKLGPQVVGGRQVEGSLAGLTPEMRMRIERERRARAAEARFKQ